jgi:hypothetical protein
VHLGLKRDVEVFAFVAARPGSVVLGRGRNWATIRTPGMDPDERRRWLLITAVTGGLASPAALLAAWLGRPTLWQVTVYRDRPTNVRRIA